MNKIDPTVRIEGDIVFGTDVTIAPYTVLHGNIRIGNGCSIGPHCHILGHTDIGKETSIHAGVVIGDIPQDRDFKGETSFTKIGNNCKIREYVTIHRGTMPDSSTIIGDNVMLMALCHVAHNCVVESNVVFTNMAALSGHVHVEEGASLSVGSVAHQFVRIGRYAMTSAYARINKDVPPYCLLAEGDWIYGPNTIALQRAGVSQDIRNAIKNSIKILFFSSLPHRKALQSIEQKYGYYPEIQHFLSFIHTSKRGIMSGNPKRGKGKIRNE